MSSLPSDLGIIIVDHGSKRKEANDLLLDVVKIFRDTSGAGIVEAAHMELAVPTIRDAFAACVEQGAARIVVHPYFLAPGRHSTTDIPSMVEEAATDFPDVGYTVTEPLGLDPRMSEVALRRIREALDKS